MIRLAALSVGLVGLLSAGQAVGLPVRSALAPQVNTSGFAPIITQTGNALTVDLRANRTIIDWSSFNIASGETVTFAFDFRSWVALNRTTDGPITINGQLNAIQAASVAAGGPPGGNIWLYSPRGVVFGPNARVDVGGLLATSSALDPSAFLVSGSLTHTLTGSGAGGSIDVQSGAQLNAVGGLSLLGPIVTTAVGSTLFATHERSVIAYGAADSYEIRMRIIENGDLSLVDFIVPSAAVGTASSNPLVLAGTSLAGNVFALATGRQGLASILISAPGLIVATSSTALEGQVKIGSGRQLVAADFDIELNARQVPGAPPGSLVMGTARADGYITIALAGETSLGDLTADGLSAGASLGIVARSVTVGAGGLTVARTGLGRVGEDTIYLDVSGTIQSPFANATADVLIFRGPNQIGRGTTRPNIDLGTATGARLRLFGGTVNTGTLAARSLIEGNVTSFTNTSLTAPSVSLVGLGDATFAFGSVSTPGTFSVTTGAAPITVGTINAASLLINTAGDATFGTTTLAGGFDVTAATATFGRTTIGGDARLQASNPNLLNLFSARNLTVEARLGSITLGGPGTAGLSNSEFQNLRLTGDLTVFGGPNVPGALRGDIILQDLDINPTQVSSLYLRAGPDNDVRVSGAVRPTAPGTTLQVGEAAAGSNWTPRSILITGSLGSARSDPVAGFTDVKSFGQVALYAKADILIGSQRFIDLIAPIPAAQINIARGLPFGVAATDGEQGKLFVVSGRLTAVAGNRIVQQNTGSPSREAGLYLTGEGTSVNDPLLILGNAQLTDLFGAVAGTGGISFGRQTPLSSRIARADADGAGSTIRINGCPLGSGCVDNTPANQFRIETFPGFSAVTAVVDPPILRSQSATVDEDEREAETVVTGSGNEEIWRARK